MTFGLQVIDPATDYPVSLEEVAAYLRADAYSESDHLTALLDMAVEEVERYTGRTPRPTTYRLTLADWPRGNSEFASYPRNPLGAYVRTLELPRCPVSAIDSVKYYADGSDVLSTLSPTQYIAVTAYEPGMVYLKEGYEWPEVATRPDAVQVEFTAGYADAASTPKAIKTAVLLLCRFYYAGGNPNDVDQGGNDLEKAHLVLNKLRATGWSA